MTRIEQEKRIVRKMIELYCRHHLHQDTMPDEYLHLADFACRRLDHPRTPQFRHKASERWQGRELPFSLEPPT